jgi:hypothetical protein
MSAPVQVVLLVLGLIVTARARLNAVVFGHLVSLPWLGVIAAALVLALAAVVLVLLRLLLRDGLRLRPRAVNP